MKTILFYTNNNFMKKSLLESIKKVKRISVMIFCEILFYFDYSFIEFILKYNLMILQKLNCFCVKEYQAIS